MSSKVEDCLERDRRELIQGSEEEDGGDKKNFRHPSPRLHFDEQEEEYEPRKRISSSDLQLKILLNCILHFSYFFWFSFLTHFLQSITSSIFKSSLKFKDTSKMARYRSTTAIDTTKSDFNDFYEIASHPRALLQPQVSIESKDGKKRRPFTSFFSNGLHIPPAPSSAVPTIGSNYLQTPIIVREPSSAPILESGFEDQGSHSDSNKRYLRRGSFILSSGRDKFTFDSEAMTSPTVPPRRTETQTLSNMNNDIQQPSYYHHTSSTNSNDNNNSTGYVNYNDLAMKKALVRAPMIAKRTSSQLSSTTSGSDVTTSSARSDVSDLNENISVHSLHPFSYGTSSSSHSYHSNNDASSGGNQYQRQTSCTSSSHLNSNTSTPSTTTSSSFHPLTSPHHPHTSHSTSPSSPTSSMGGKPFHAHHPTRMKRTSVVRSAHMMENPSRPVQSNGRFGNPWDTWAPLRFTNILKWGLAKDKSNIPSKEQLDIVLPIVKPNFEAAKNLSISHDEEDDTHSTCSSIPGSHSSMTSMAMAVTWLGHASVVIQMDGVTFITDPIFSDRASPSQMVGPKRYRDPPCSIHDLPSDLDAVLISHNHYDHLDMNSVTLLNARFGVDLRWFVPLGLSTWFEAAGCENVVELDWWEENCVPEKGHVSFVFTPAQHWSKRTLNDDNKSLWGGWAVIGPKHRFYYPGDTGYCPVFRDIGRIYGPFDVCAIPIGAYEPRWFMRAQHVNPEEAVKIHQDVKSKFTVAIHWGTFALANEYYLDPPVKLREALDEKGLPLESFITFKHGETRLMGPDGTSIPTKTPRKKHPHHT